jgi:hypothetical protein
MNNIKNLIKYPLSDDEIFELLNGQTKIVLYPDLKKYKNIDELFYPYDNVVILYIVQNKNGNVSGHWVGLLKRGDTIEFFDSYGSKPDDTFDHIDYDVRVQNGEIKPLLSRLLKNSPYKLEYNEKQLQKLKYGINTCGYYVVLRILLKDLSIKEFQQLFNGKNNDINVIKYILKILS